MAVENGFSPEVNAALSLGASPHRVKPARGGGARSPVPFAPSPSGPRPSTIPPCIPFLCILSPAVPANPYPHQLAKVVGWPWARTTSSPGSPSAQAHRALLVGACARRSCRSANALKSSLTASSLRGGGSWKERRGEQARPIDPAGPVGPAALSGAPAAPSHSLTGSSPLAPVRLPPASPAKRAPELSAGGTLAGPRTVQCAAGFPCMIRPRMSWLVTEPRNWPDSRSRTGITDSAWSVMRSSTSSIGSSG